MKSFNLEEALKGEPVLLKNGDKGYVKFLVPDACSKNTQTEFVGYGISVHDEFYICEWDGEGNDRLYDESSIIGMWG
ncbi:pyruvate kinase [[Pasteurella] mairii]|uniref:Pyruvate kinase n=1 Tax=[Pasteurella] mairii TaxID=757 RepID=A0A379B654_9PAST|nr:pyruvate kinase [[Pasteurella] mairii]